MTPAPAGQGREENAARAAWRGFKHFSAWLDSFCSYPLRPPGRASEGPVVGNLRFPPEAPPCNLPRNSPSLSEPSASPSARCPRVPTKASLSEHSDLSARDRMEGHAQAPRHVSTLPAVRPGQGFGGSQVVSALRQSLRRRAGVRTKGNTLGLTSCRPPCGDGCVRPPVPKAKLWLEQAGSEHRASARGKGGDSGVWKGASKGGNAPITGPFPPPGGHEGRVVEGRG